MPKIAIITDSTATMPDELIAQYNIEVAPQVLIWGEESLRDGVDITPVEFYNRLVRSDVIPTTSQATVGAFKELFEPHVQAGDQVLAILLSDKLSGTIQSAEQAKAMFPGATIEIVNSNTIAMSLGFQVLIAARAAAEGKPFEEVVALARRARDHTGVIFVVDTLDYLHRGGRIGGASRLLGSALNIKPLLEVADGRVEPVERVRTKAKAKKRLLQLVEERVKGRSPVRLAALHIAAEEEARALLDEAAGCCDPQETYLTTVSPVIGVHVGPGTVGIAYCAGI